MIKFLFIFIFLCVSNIYAKESNNDINVVASIRPIHSIVSAVMQDVSKPTLLLNKEQSPHNPILKPSQIKQLQNADIIFMIEPEFETYLKKPLKSLKPNTLVIYLQNVSGITKLPYRENADGHSHHHDHKSIIDGHIWLSPANAKIMINTIADILATQDPKNKRQYLKNAASYNHKLAELDEEISQELKPVKKKPFLVFHDGYQYFQHYYELNGQGSIVFEPNDPLKASRLQEIEKQIKDQKIQCIFQDTPGNPRVIKLFEKQFKIYTQTLDPLGVEIPEGPELYLKLLKNLSNHILQCLSK